MTNLLSARLSLGFSCVGHAMSHMFQPIFYVVALSLEGETGMTHGEVMALIVVGSALFGVVAPVAGWLGDRWRATGMMAIYFAGCGFGLVMTGLAESPWAIGLWLAVTGAFASIYHPVGIAWLIRNAVNRGTALGINGVFGGVGPGLAALMAGALTDWFGWRSAFLAPGLFMILVAVGFQFLVMRGTIVERSRPLRADPPVARRDVVRAFMVLLVTMFCTGIIYQALQAAMPKLFADRMVSVASDGVADAGFLVALVYFVAGAMQVAAGMMADRFPLKMVYMAAFVLQMPVLMLAGLAGGYGVVIVAMLAATMNVGALPAENSLVARFAPPQWHGLAFGLKFIFAFGLAGLGVWLEGALYDLTGGFTWLFSILAATALVAACAVYLLPGDRPAEAVAAE